MLGYTIPYQELTEYSFREAKLARSFVRWLVNRIEVPQRCYVERPEELSYIDLYNRRGGTKIINSLRNFAQGESKWG